MTNQPADGERDESDLNCTAECFVSRDAIARSKEDEIARHRGYLHDKVGAAVANRIADKGSHLVAIVDTAWPDNDLRALGLRTKAYVTGIPGAIEQRQRLKDSEAALAAAAEQLREKDEELKRLGERLAAAERLLLTGLTFTDGKMRIERRYTRPGLALVPVWKSYTGTYQDPIEHGNFSTPMEAAVAANWLPQPEQQGGG